jgi:hypothetical protein
LEIPTVVSSQVIHVPHGVEPPEQFRTVPLKLVNEFVGSRDCLSTISVVVPPAASKS